MRAERLLALAEWLCGAHARAAVFEPLVADWQREWRTASIAGERAWVLLRGGGAFAVTLALSIDTREAVQRHARRVGWTALPIFTLLGTVLCLLPLLWWIRDWRSVSETAPLPYMADFLFWNAPFVISYGVLFAIVPAILALGAGGAGRRQLVLAGALAIATFIALEGWAMPWMSEWRLREKFGARATETSSAARRTTWDYVRLTRHPDAQIAADARASLYGKAGRPVLMTGLALIGAAIGLSRAHAHRDIGVRTLIGYWFFGWAAAVTLGFFANYLSFYLALRPYRLSTWLPPLALLLVGAAACIAPTQRAESSTFPRA